MNAASALDFRGRPATALLLAAFGALFVSAYREPFGVMFTWWGGGDYSYCLLLPPLLLYVLWTDRARLAAAAGPGSWRGAWLLAAGGLCYSLGEFGAEFYSIFLSSLLILMGLTVCLAGGRILRRLAFPSLLYLCMLPLPEFFTKRLSLDLQLLSSRLGEIFIRAVGMPVYREGNIIDLGFLQLQVLEPCSGLRYLFPLVVLGIILAHYRKAALWAKIVLVASSVPVSVLLNALRLAVTAVSARFLGPRVAGGAAHEFVGWGVFVLSFGILYAVGALLGRVAPGRPAVPPAAEPRASRAGAPVRRGPALAAVLLLAFLAVFVTGRGGEEKPPTDVNLASFPLRIGGWQGRANAMPPDLLARLSLSQYVDVDYANAKGEMVNLYVAYYRSQRKGEALHSPETCLPASGWRVERDGDVRIPAGAGGGSFFVRSSLARKGEDRVLTYYWFEQDGRTLTSLPMLKLSTFWEALTRRRSDGSFVRVYTTLGRGEDAQAAALRLRRFLADMRPQLLLRLAGEDAPSR